MVCWRWGNMLSGAGLICDLVRSSSLIDHTWIVDRATGPCDERQPAGGATCSWLPDRERRLQGNHAAQAIFGEWPVSALCGRWLAIRRMGEDAPLRTASVFNRRERTPLTSNPVSTRA